MHTDLVQRLDYGDDVASGMSHLVVVQDIDLPVDAFRRALEDGDPEWLGPALDEDDPDGGMTRHLTDLGLHIAERATGMLRKAAFVDIGQPRAVGSGYVVEISWRAATLAPLFPVFAGELAIAEGQLRIEGWYAPPGGLAGRVADRMLLNLAARSTARWLLAALADVVRCREATAA